MDKIYERLKYLNYRKSNYLSFKWAIEEWFTDFKLNIIDLETWW